MQTFPANPLISNGRDIANTPVRGTGLSFARAVRAHRGVENRLHWVLDVVFRDDLARFRTGDGPQNMAIIRHTALNLLSRARPTISLKNARRPEHRLPRKHHPIHSLTFKRLRLGGSQAIG